MYEIARKKRAGAFVCRTAANGSPAGRLSQAARAQRLHGHVRAVADDRVDAPIEQALDVAAVVDRPDLHRQPRRMRVANELGGHDGGMARGFRHLELPIARAASRPAHSTTEEGP